MNQKQATAYILDLARAGAFDFALKEYHRLKLDHECHDEDVMALLGRLYKDRYLAGSPANTQEAAQLSVQAYEKAFIASGGFYSGINAASMSFVAGDEPVKIAMKAQDILTLLPSTPQLNAEVLYFIEATRAEAFLLLGQRNKARSALKLAWNYDPLNYIAHASTLKQFHMIEKHQGADSFWLDSFNPPRSMHFTGHVFNSSIFSMEQLETFRESISSAIQQQDVGFGFGALAAGADIEFAEALLAEGCELHVFLPSDIETFVENSILPFGQEWLPRFRVCLDRAESFTIAQWIGSTTGAEQTRRAQQHTSVLSMGSALHLAQLHLVDAIQMAFWDGVKSSTGTGWDVAIWEAQNLSRINFSVPKEHPKKPKTHISPYSYHAFLSGVDMQMQSFPVLQDAILAGFIARNENPEHPVVLELATYPNTPPSEDRIRTLLDAALPGSFIVSQSAASHANLFCPRTVAVSKFEILSSGEQLFALSPLPNLY